MLQVILGELVLKKRNEKGYTQEKLATLCDLDTRTIQRIEKGEVKPYFSTLKLLSGVLGHDFIQEINHKPWQFSEEEKHKYRETFKIRRRLRIAIMIIALATMLMVAATFPSFRLFGFSKQTWGPVYAIFMIGLIIAIGVTWRCPACRASLGPNPFNTRFCSRCGFKFE